MFEEKLLALLRKAGRLQIQRLLDDDAAFDQFLKDNPLTPEEELEVKAMVERLAKKFRERS